MHYERLNFARVSSVKKNSRLFSFLCFKMGETIFPLFEPMLKFFENKDPEVRMHFNQALLSLKQSKKAIALLNLNMVLSLKPNHFLARVFRGRIYVKEGQYRLASEDYLEANRISQYRFIHYDLYREYFKSVNNEFGRQPGQTLNSFDDVFDSIHLIQGCKDLETEAGQEFEGKLSLTETDDILSYQDLALTPEEKEKFETLGPISQEEIEETDWDLFMDDLNS
jgi:tetratricopeptide (TPR) repeat protein